MLGSCLQGQSDVDTGCLDCRMSGTDHSAKYSLSALQPHFVHNLMCTATKDGYAGDAWQCM